MRGLSFALVVSFVLYGCNERPVQELSNTAATVEQRGSNVQRLVDGNNQFACKLYAELRRSEGNLFFSPVSISTALSTILPGARSTTAEQMRHVLHWELPNERLYLDLASLRLQLQSRQKGLEVALANRLWAQTDVKLSSEFVGLLKGRLGAEVGQIDFAELGDDARHPINAWIAKETDDHIHELLASGAVDSSTRLVLTNAISFDGEWAQPFDGDLTEAGTFHIDTNRSTDVTLMRQEHEFRFCRVAGVSCLELPYQGEKFSMWLFLPDEVDGLRSFEAGLTVEQIKRCLQAAKLRTVRVELPVFELASEFEMQDILGDMGIVDAFEPDVADFSRMFPGSPYHVSVFVHKAYVAVNEQGTEAAAATGVVATGDDVNSPAPAAFRADHPFVYMIRDNELGQIVFLGRLVDPLSAGETR